MSDEPGFTVAVVTAEEEAAVVHGADLGYDHPDNGPTDAEADAILAALAEHDEELPNEDELDALVADVDPDDIDAAGFDDSDIVSGSSDEPGTAGS